nr:immunoglobulin light chain junction region [Macaca mulatta]
CQQHSGWPQLTC